MEVVNAGLPQIPTAMVTILLDGKALITLPPLAPLFVDSRCVHTDHHLEIDFDLVCDCTDPGPDVPLG